MKTNSGKKNHRGLIPKFNDPFTVVKHVGQVAYKLALLERLNVHSTCHLSYLKPFHKVWQDPSRAQAKRAPPTIRAQFE